MKLLIKEYMLVQETVVEVEDLKDFYYNTLGVTGEFDQEVSAGNKTIVIEELKE